LVEVYFGGNLHLTEISKLLSAEALVRMGIPASPLIFKGVVAQISQSPQGFQQLGSRKNGIFMRIYSLKPLVHKDLIMQQSHF
jgi:hypothetical protein